ncbi:DUF389 domain-containing protein [Pontibacter sp. SGAir0037]|uniref:DUF389 domain-containing protein n=1 Tax=Pontibacter sp. SGAir0037 TaxID=2571030 RepID=UPI0010CD2EB8|nr:DUF389 domain-containing protein [Pontibacter sp. SGAir0037]QCR23240.1 TIGR00341 family protein [Pontibacter sp. SGAir0037]
MRELTIKVPRGRGTDVLKMAEEMQGKNLSKWEGEDGDLIKVHVNNQKVSQLLDKLKDIEEAEITLIPRGVVAMYPPPEQAPEQVVDVNYRSPIEIFFGGLQSVGSKVGLISYALSGGIIAWIGLYTETSYLLVAAMLVAPFAGPAMNAALGAAAGKGGLLLKSLGRYFLSIGVAVAVSYLLSLLIQQKHATQMMVSISQISEVTILLPLIAGFAGGINLVQSERDSLVSGAAVGMLVAASLAPPTSMLGMALNFGNWQMIRSSLFLLLLQLAGIQLSAAMVFRYMGKVTTKGVRFSDGKESVFITSLVVSALVVAGMMYWQFSTTPQLRKASIDTQATELIKTSLSEMPAIETIEVTAHFTRGTLPDRNPLVCQVSVIREEGNDKLSDEELKQQIVEKLTAAIAQEEYNAYPVFDVTILHKPRLQ